MIEILFSILFLRPTFCLGEIIAGHKNCSHELSRRNLVIVVDSAAVVLETLFEVLCVLLHEFFPECLGQQVIG